MNQANFNLFKTEDFVLDEDFRNIVRASDSSDRLKDLIENLPEKREEIVLAVKILQGLQIKEFQQSHARKEELWQQVFQTQEKKIRYLYFKVAASLILLLGIGSAIFHFATPKQDLLVVTAVESTPNNAILILANGKKVLISGKQSTVHYSSDGSGILVNDSAMYAESIKVEGPNQIIVPFGKRSFIQLSDGTKVWLNSGSKLIFPTVFNGKTREVQLEGEAFFDVTKNKNKPFLVNTDLFSMKVYGTKFNVQSYLHDNESRIVLVEGKVSMNPKIGSHSAEVFLEPNQMAIVSKDKKTFEISNVQNTGCYTDWLNGYLTFSNEKIADVLKRISRYYNVPIDAELFDNNEKIYGKLDLKDSLERVLNGITYISKTKYEKSGNKYVFINKK